MALGSQKTAPGAVFKREATWLPGNRPKYGSWLPKVDLMNLLTCNGFTDITNINKV